MTVSEYAESKGIPVKTVLARIRRVNKLDGVNIEKVGKTYLLTPTVNKALKVVNNGASVNKSKGQLLTPDERFTGRSFRGRGVPVNGMVLVSIGDDDRMVSESEWRERMTFTCEHGFMGWSCKRCLRKDYGLSEVPQRAIRNVSKMPDFTVKEQVEEYAEALGINDMGKAVVKGTHTLNDGRTVHLVRREKAE